MSRGGRLELFPSLTRQGICLTFRGRSYHIAYPQEIWEAVPEAVKLLLLDNLSYAAAMHLPMKLKGVKGLHFHSGRPFFEPYFLQNFLRDIPSCCDMDGIDIAGETQRFLELSFSFDVGRMRLPAPWPSGKAGRPVKALVPLSFGKDSLLTFALSEELGLDPVPVFVDEPGFSQERAHKEVLAEEFLKEFGKDLNILEHSTGLLRDDEHLGTGKDEYGWGLQSTEYALMMLPYARAFGAGYILFGNEQSAGSSYRDASGRWTVYPCYDQTHLWTGHIDAMTASLTGEDPVRTGSLIEPLMDMMIQRMLVRRYPAYAKYQMSCFAEGEAGKHDRWCHECSICAKMYLMCLGGGVDPAAVGFKRSMLTEEQLRFFPIFGGESGFPYARTGLARDEQLFAFHCAARFGAEDPLVERFKTSALAEEARDREGELLARFVRQYPAISVPVELGVDLKRIYTEEIDHFMRLYEGI